MTQQPTQPEPRQLPTPSARMKVRPFRLSEQLLADLEEVAAGEGLSVSSLVRRVLTLYCKTQIEEKERRRYQEWGLNYDLLGRKENR